MSRLPVTSGRDAVRAFEKVGYRVSHQTGSHIILRHEAPPHRHLSIPNHRELAKGTLPWVDPRRRFDGGGIRRASLMPHGASGLR